MLRQCFKQGCELEVHKSPFKCIRVQFACQCLSVDTYSCEFHFAAHLKLPNRTHFFDPILVEPLEGSKDAILGLLEKDRSKLKNLNEIVSASFRPNLYNSRNSIEEALKRLDSGLEKITSLINKISQDPKQEQDIYYSLRADANIDRIRDADPEFSEANSSLKFWRLSELKTKKSPILNEPNNARAEREFRRACLQYETQIQGSKLSDSQVFQDNADAYHQITSLYLIGEKAKRTNLFIYDTENEIEQAKVLKTPWNFNPKDIMIVQLPSGDLFCISNERQIYIIDRNYRIRALSIKIDFKIKTAIYFKRSVYCFGDGFPRSIRFDLNKNDWFKLALMFQNADRRCNSVIFNEKILISGWKHKKLLLYSIDIDSFTKVPYYFANKSTKILINEAERVYLIECPGFVYESEVSDVFSWQQIAKSIINYQPSQVYCSYNKCGIYISIIYGWTREYYKFDLDQKTLTEIAYYGEHVAIRRVNNKLEAIEWYSQTFKLYSEYLEEYIQKGHTLWDLGNELEKMEDYNEKIKFNPRDVLSYYYKAITLAHLGNKHEAIEYFNEAIKLNPNASYYHNKGNALAYLGRKNEAIECHNEAIKLNPNNSYSHYNKGIILSDLGKNKETIECFNNAINLNPNEFKYFCYRAYILNDLGQETEALKNFNRAYDLMQEMQSSEDNCEPNPYRTGLLRKLSELQRRAANFKDELQELKSVFWENTGLVKEIEEKEVKVKEQYSQLLKRAVKCICSDEPNQIELIDQIEEEVVELIKKVDITISQLKSDTSN